MKVVNSTNRKTAIEQLATLIWAFWKNGGGDDNCEWDAFWRVVRGYAEDLASSAEEDGLKHESAFSIAWDARRDKPVDCAPKSTEAEPFWKDIDGYGGGYSVNYWGEIRSNKSGIRLCQRETKRGKGYWYVSLWHNGQEKKHYVHRLVAQAFIPNPENKATVNHKNGRTYHNSKDNLEWMTHQEQQDHAWATGLTNNRGENCGTSKLTEDRVIAIRQEFRAGGVTQTALAKKYGVTQPQVSKIVNDKQWSD